MRKLLMAIVVLLVIPATAYAGGGGGTSRCPGFASGTTISMLDSCFDGTAHFARTDTTLTISNDGEFPHTFTAVDGSFDSGTLQAGETFEVAIDESGVFQFFCTLHGTAQGDGMAGVLLVGEAEPSPVSAAVNVAADRQAVAEENQIFAETLDRQMGELNSENSNVQAAIDRQTQAIVELSDAQAELNLVVGSQVDTPDAVASSPPTIVTLPAQSTTDTPWLPMGAGLAAGLAVAALLANRPRRLQNPGMNLGGAPSSATD